MDVSIIMRRGGRKGSNYDDLYIMKVYLGQMTMTMRRKKHEWPKISLSKIDYQVGCQTMDFCVNNDIWNVSLMSRSSW